MFLKLHFAKEESVCSQLGCSRLSSPGPKNPRVLGEEETDLGRDQCYPALLRAEDCSVLKEAATNCD